MSSTLYEFRNLSDHFKIFPFWLSNFRRNSFFCSMFCTVILTNVSQFREVYLLIYKMFNSVKTTSTCHTKGKQKTKTSQWWWQVKRPADTDKRIILDNVYWVNRSVWSIWGSPASLKGKKTSIFSHQSREIKSTSWCSVNRAKSMGAIAHIQLHY